MATAGDSLAIHGAQAVADPQLQAKTGPRAELTALLDRAKGSILGNLTAFGVRSLIGGCRRDVG